MYLQPLHFPLRLSGFRNSHKVGFVYHISYRVVLSKLPNFSGNRLQGNTSPLGIMVNALLPIEHIAPICLSLGLRRQNKVLYRSILGFNVLIKEGLGGVNDKN